MMLWTKAMVGQTHITTWETFISCVASCQWKKNLLTNWKKRLNERKKDWAKLNIISKSQKTGSSVIEVLYDTSKKDVLEKAHIVGIDSVNDRNAMYANGNKEK